MGKTIISNVKNNETFLENIIGREIGGFRNYILIRK